MHMKSICFTVLACLLLQAGIAQNKDSIKVAAAVETLRKAMVDPNKSVLDQIIAEELSYGHSGGKIDTKASLEEALLSGASDFVSIDLTEQTIRVAGHTAIVRHKLSAKTNDGGKPGEVKLGILLIWQKQNKEWKLLARQAIKLL